MQSGNPQTEHGYLKIANELQVALCRVHLNSNCWRVLNAIIRKTYGWQKNEDAISLSQFTELTGLPKSSVCRAIRQLIEQKVITKKSGAITVYGLNKRYKDWQNCHSDDIATVAKSTMNVNEIDNQGVTEPPHTKDTVTKDTLTKDKDMSAPPTPPRKGDETVTVAIPSTVVGETVRGRMKMSELEEEYRGFLKGVSQILGKDKVFSPAGLKKYRTRRETFTVERLCEAFMNLEREPDRWKIQNNSFRPMQWWLRSDDYIVELEHVHEKQVRGARPQAAII